MSRPESTPPARRPPAAKAQISPEVADILVPSLQVGLGAGTIGLFVGAASGIVRSTTPVLFSLVTGAQWFALGSSYYGSRSAIISAWGGESTLTPWDNVKASTLAGASAGFVGGSLRGPRNILPAVAIFSIFGASGQAVLNAMSTGATPDAKSKSDWLASKWSPVTPMTDTEYATFIQDKILKLDVEVSMIDDQLAALRARKAQREAENPQREDS
ncbi:hypothetical protein HMPREF1624_02470 [Sporothrix schenckii ATCC 58251]|uniref:Uncharacterized protein n=1 Tax=Sporothrix schenckii (strain ATCC 58251 / de Perez 2211183) TaxID=1391915 RepID=U7Q044_SPOS1|nr:hypothetical protein HMPREF1624_02470 [Sporothrix schenckii ATCC 58251]